MDMEWARYQNKALVTYILLGEYINGTKHRDCIAVDLFNGSAHQPKKTTTRNYSDGTFLLVAEDEIPLRYLRKITCKAEEIGWFITKEQNVTSV